MDLGGHQRFREGAGYADARASEARPTEGRPSDGRGNIGRALLARAWAALESGRAESVDIQLASGALLRGVIALRVEGQVADASTRRGEWTHAFGLEDVALIRSNPRGSG